MFNVDYQLLISALLKTLFWKNSLNSYLFFFSYFNVAMITKPQFDFHIVCMMSISSKMTRTIRIKKRNEIKKKNPNEFTKFICLISVYHIKQFSFTDIHTAADYKITSKVKNNLRLVRVIQKLDISRNDIEAIKSKRNFKLNIVIPYQIGIKVSGYLMGYWLLFKDV